MLHSQGLSKSIKKVQPKPSELMHMTKNITGPIIFKRKTKIITSCVLFFSLTVQTVSIFTMPGTQLPQLNDNIGYFPPYFSTCKHGIKSCPKAMLKFLSSPHQQIKPLQRCDPSIYVACQKLNLNQSQLFKVPESGTLFRKMGTQKKKDILDFIQGIDIRDSKHPWK